MLHCTTSLGPRYAATALHLHLKIVAAELGLPIRKSFIIAQIEIPGHLHSRMIGQNGASIRPLAAATDTRIRFLQPGTSSAVAIAGAPTGVKQAINSLQGLSPITLTFELQPQETQSLLSISQDCGQTPDQCLQQALNNENFEVLASTRQRSLQLTISLRALESRVSHLYKARRFVLLLLQHDDFGHDYMDVDSPIFDNIDDDPSWPHKFLVDSEETESASGQDTSHAADTVDYEKKRLLAEAAIKSPDLSQPRVPTE